MEAYPIEYVEHNLPFILLFGLDEQPETRTEPLEASLLQNGGFVIKSDLPLVSGERVQQLLRQLRSHDGKEQPWRTKPAGDQGGLHGFRVKSVGRKYVLPPRKADPPKQSLSHSPPQSPNAPSSQSWILHSPLSPLSPDSPIFPDGLMTPLWLKKHQEYIPSALVSFFDFSSDMSLDSLNDNQLKSDINQINSALKSSGYKSRHVVVLVSDGSTQDIAAVEERLQNLKRATGLDSKNTLFLLPPSLSDIELSNFASSILAALQPHCVEFYRDLTKHSRRKKTRGSIPAPTAPPTKGTSQALSAPGWNVRYEFKLGIFAEFRQEMDAAGRHFNFALDALLTADGMFETTASWSPRWDDMRLLADCVALRLIRTLLWNASTTSAVQIWVRYRDRMREIVDKRGKGSSNYGWEAWESRWAKVMAELVHRADLPVFSLPPPASEPESLIDWVLNIFSPPEKAIPVGERLSPWELLHHPAYWHRLAGIHAKRRQSLAKALPDEDRTPPAQSPAALVASRHNTYDTYLCPEPHAEFPQSGENGFSHVEDIFEKYARSSRDFLDRKQQRFSDQCELEQAAALMKDGSHGQALLTLERLWQNMCWRRERWWGLVHRITIMLHECAMNTKDPKLIVLTTWELMSNIFPAPPGNGLDFDRCLKGIGTDDANKLDLVLDANDVVSFFSASFSFAAMEGHVADRLKCQLVLTSRAHPGSAPVTFNGARVELEGSITSIDLLHEADKGAATTSKAESRLSVVELNEDHESPIKSSYNGAADLKLHPGQTIALEMEVVFREAGEVNVLLMTMVVENDHFKLRYVQPTPEAQVSSTAWWRETASGLAAKRIPRQDDGILRVHPKPPKLEVSLRDKREFYYTDEPAVLDFLLANLEEEEANVSLDVRVLNGADERVQFSWTSEAGSESQAESELSAESDTLDLPGHRVGKLAPDEERTVSIRLKAPSDPLEYLVEVKALYHLASDTQTPISKTSSTTLSFVSPFEANYDFAPRIHPEPWPSYFTAQELKQDPDTTDAGPFGLKHRWSLNAKMASFADETVIIEGAEIIVNTSHGGITAKVSKSTKGKMAGPISPKEMRALAFTVDVQKSSLEDRRPAALETALQISWRRDKSSPEAPATTILTTLSVPRLLMPNLEPRVLLTSTSARDVPHLKRLTYTIENPTLHFLTFDLSMDASEEFAISGSKVVSVNVLPMSRAEVEYRVLPLVRGAWVVPGLKVVDRYFGKVLRVMGGEGTGKGPEKDGVAVWVEEDNVEQQ